VSAYEHHKNLRWIQTLLMSGEQVYHKKRYVPPWYPGLLHQTYIQITKVLFIIWEKVGINVLKVRVTGLPGCSSRNGQNRP
jgi:hypothetical protein